MKVIKYGPGWKPHTLTCDSCKSELEYTDIDIKVDTHCDYMFNPVGSTHYIICPICGLYNIIKKEFEYEKYQ